MVLVFLRSLLIILFLSSFVCADFHLINGGFYNSSSGSWLRLPRWKPYDLTASIPVFPTEDQISMFNITLIYPENNEKCITGEVVEFRYSVNVQGLTECYLFHNNTGSWIIEAVDYSPINKEMNKINDTLNPNTIEWTIQCRNDTTVFISNSGNFSFILVDKPYCAELSDISCPSNISLGRDYIFSAQLKNTRGYVLPNQDCDVWITNNNGDLIENFDTIIENDKIIEDELRNYYVLGQNKTAFLTDESGYYIYSFLVNNSWAYVGDNYTVNFVCNGELGSCNFTVSKSSLVDVEGVRRLSKSLGGLILLFMVIFGSFLVLYTKR